MATESLLQSISLIAAADLSDKQFYIGKIDSAGKVALCGAGENSIGIIQDKPESGIIGSVGTFGISMGIYGNSVTAGQALMSDSSGKLITQTGTNYVVATALTSGVTNDIQTVMLPGSAKGYNTTYSIWTIPIQLDTVTAADVVTTYTPGFAGSILKVSFVVSDPVTTGSKAASINIEIGTTNLTGGVVALTSANSGTLGITIDGTSITGNNVFSDSDTISVEASSVTAFTEGTGFLLLALSSAT